MLTLRSQFQEIIRKQSRIFHSHFCHPIWTNTNRSTITEKRSSQIMVASDPRCVFCLTKPLTLIWIDWYTTIFVPLHCIDSCSLKTPVFHLLRASSSSTQCAPDAIDPSGRTRDPLDLSSLNIFIDPSNSVRAGWELRFANSVVAIWLCNSSIHYIQTSFSTNSPKWATPILGSPKQQQLPKHPSLGISCDANRCKTHAMGVRSQAGVKWAVVFDRCLAPAI